MRPSVRRVTMMLVVLSAAVLGPAGSTRAADSDRVHLQRAATLYAASKFDDAIVELRSIDPHGLGANERLTRQLLLGRSLSIVGRPKEAVAVLSVALPGNPSATVTRLAALADAQAAAGSVDAALRTAASLVEIARTNRLSELAGLLEQAGSVAMQARQPQLATKRYAEALVLRRPQRDPSALASTLHLLGWSESIQPTTQKVAIAHLREAETLRRELRDRTGLADTLALLAGLLVSNGQPSPSLAASTEALRIGFRDVSTYVTTELTKASAEVALGDLAAAVLTLRDAVRRSSATTARQRGDALHELGWVLSMQSAHDDAIQALREGVQVRLTVPNGLASVSDTRRLLGYVLSGASRYHEAVTEFDAVVGAARRGVLPSGTNMATTLTDLGGVLVLAGEPRRAVAVLSEAVGLANAGAAPDLATALHLLGWAQVAAGDPQAARTNLESALAIRDRLGLSTQAAETRAVLASLR